MIRDIHKRLLSDIAKIAPDPRKIEIIHGLANQEALLADLDLIPHASRRGLDIEPVFVQGIDRIPMKDDDVLEIFLQCFPEAEATSKTSIEKALQFVIETSRKNRMPVKFFL